MAVILRSVLFSPAGRSTLRQHRTPRRAAYLARIFSRRKDRHRPGRSRGESREGWTKSRGITARERVRAEARDDDDDDNDSDNDNDSDDGDDEERKKERRENEFENWHRRSIAAAPGRSVSLRLMSRSTMTVRACEVTKWRG
ncbi:ATPase family AAA domain-containing protein 2-like [Mycetomoellerius zeteki]|uniref:ATPase family AAA domain-containing protein 2-like n=1 Tax=Mycetomoellerius zeteki TaxID=64791 RepID=UPI00084E57AB|nr:PREDICTED: ATPase family AAA domain-containing protein 2-like [Trachymyrmex zeteki]